MLEGLKDLGFKKVITTPHTHPKYPNTPQLIMRGLDQVREEMNRRQLEVDMEAASEYFVDETFLNRLDSGEDLLSFGNKYVLVECSFINKPMFFEAAVFKIRSHGYNPILAHPERYQFLQGDISWLQEMKETGVLFQVTIASLAGYYGKTPKKIAETLLQQGMIDFLSSDLHRPSQLEWLEKGLKLKSVQKLIQSGELLNNSLL